MHFVLIAASGQSLLLRAAMLCRCLASESSVFSRQLPKTMYMSTGTAEMCSWQQLERLSLGLVRRLPAVVECRHSRSLAPSHSLVHGGSMPPGGSGSYMPIDQWDLGTRLLITCSGWHCSSGSFDRVYKVSYAFIACIASTCRRLGQ